MQADERQAAVAYTYAWWLTGDDDAAADALRAAVTRPGPPAGEPADVALARGVREHVGDLQAMPASSEMTLLHDGLDIDLVAAAEIAGVAADDIPAGLAHGRLEALLETIREPFDHPERLGGLATAEAGDLAHARQCPSCARATTLLERGRTELREVVAVSAPAGLLGQLVAQGAAAQSAPPDIAAVEHEVVPPPDIDAPRDTDVTDAATAEAPPVVPPAVDVPVDVDAPMDVDAPVDLVEPAAVVAEPEVDDAPAEAPPADADADAEVDVAQADTEVDSEVDTEVDGTTEIVLDEPVIDVDLDEAPPATDDGAAVEHDDVFDLTEAPAPPVRRPVVKTRARTGTASMIAGAGIVTVCLLVVVLVGKSGPETPAPADDATTEDPAVQDPQPTDGGPQRPNNNGPQQGPPGASPRDFRVVQTGLLLPDENQPAASGAEIAPEDLIRIAVDYEGATQGVQLTAIWRVDEEDFDRLDALVSARSSRHVWGVTPPEDGWPPGQHRIVLTADESVAGAIDFTVSNG